MICNIIPTLSKEDKEYLKAGGFSDDVIVEYMRFMTLNKICDATIAPSKAVDAVWCHHITNTKMYSTFCNRNFPSVENHHRDPSKNTRINYVATLEMLVSKFEGTMFGNSKVSIEHWPADEYLMPIRSQCELPFTKADLDRTPEDVFGKQPDLVDAYTFIRVYKIHKKRLMVTTDECLLANGFPGNVIEFKAALVCCHAMDILSFSVGRTLRVRLEEYVTFGALYSAPKFPHEGGDLIEWLGCFTLAQLLNLFEYNV